MWHHKRSRIYRQQWYFRIMPWHLNVVVLYYIPLVMSQHMPGFTSAVYVILAALLTEVHCLTGHSHITFPMCGKEVMELHSMALSQDTLYNTALSTCVKGTLMDWHYRNTFATPPTPMAEFYNLPGNSRLECSHISLECLMQLPLSLSSLLSSGATPVSTVTCVRGAHVYSMWTIPHNIAGSNTTVFQNSLLRPSEEMAEVSTNISMQIDWPWQLFATQITAVTRGICEDTAKNYVRVLCK